MLSIIVPVFNEAESLRQLHFEIDETCSVRKIDVEIIFVDDGSTDDTWGAVRNLAERDARVRGLRLRRNFGKTAALAAGIHSSQGDLVCMMDADLQDDPAEIPALLEKIAAGSDLVNGWKKHRLDPWHKVYASHVFNLMVSRLTGLKLHDHNCGLKCFRREVASEIRLYGDLHRFIPAQAHARGFKVVELAVHHRPRKFGHSKYGVRRFLIGFLDLLTVSFLTKLGQRPQHLLGAMGLMLFALGGCGLVGLLLVWLLKNVPPYWNAAPAGPSPLFTGSVAALLMGMQFMSLGFVAALLVASTVRDADTYSIAERTDVDSA